MRNPLYALLVAPDGYLRRAIMLGEQTCSIREGHREYRAESPVLLGCPEAPWAVMADITEVRHCTLGEVQEDERTRAGFDGQENMVRGLLAYYPQITISSDVTVVSWKNVRGKLVEEAKARHERNPVLLRQRLLDAGAEYIDPLIDLEGYENWFTARMADTLRLQRAYGVGSIRDLVALKAKDVLKWRNFGHKTLGHLKECLRHADLKLGMTPAEIEKAFSATL